ncbi:MAG: ATP-binding protein [Candidatus Competibacteraceae bacterium]
MDEFQRGDFAVYAPYRGQGAQGDEIEQLGAHFDRMAQRLQALIGSLQERDTLRRELVNHVSHDLRTPLAALHGYLETLQIKAGQLTDADRAIYLDAALRHSRRLGRLVGDLFELAKLDAHAIQPHRECFAAAELLQDIAQKYPPRPRAPLRLIVRLPAVALFVDADIGLLERVLDNLILNALYHTPPAGIVALELRAADGTATFAVTDTGHGIEPMGFAACIRPVLSRFEAGEGLTGNHLGLGLAIAKRIVELHGSELQVASLLERGTRFSFELPARIAAARQIIRLPAP